MDEPSDTETGIYSECLECGSLVANQQTHAAWHAANETR